MKLSTNLEACFRLRKVHTGRGIGNPHFNPTRHPHPSIMPRNQKHGRLVRRKPKVKKSTPEATPEATPETRPQKKRKLNSDHSDPATEQTHLSRTTSPIPPPEPLSPTTQESLNPPANMAESKAEQPSTEQHQPNHPSSAPKAFIPLGPSHPHPTHSTSTSTPPN